MGEEQLRDALKKRFTAMPMSEWCRLTGVHKGHCSEFLNGKRGPGSDLLNALNLRVDYVRVRKPLP